MIRKNKYDDISTGIVSGILLPIVFLFILILYRKGDFSFFEYIKMSQQIGVLPKLVSLCLIPNLALFFVFLKFNYLKSGRGVLLSMFISGLIIVILKIV